MTKTKPRKGIYRYHNIKSGDWERLSKQYKRVFQKEDNDWRYYVLLNEQGNMRGMLRKSRHAGVAEAKPQYKKL